MVYRSHVDAGMIQQYYSVGMDVIVHLGGGRSTRGRLAEIGNGSVVLATERGPALVSAEAIELIEVLDIPTVAGDLPGAVAVGRAPSPAESGPSGADTPQDGGPEPASAPPGSVSAVRRDTSLWEPLEAEFGPGEFKLTLSKPSFKRDPVVDLGYTMHKSVEQHLARAKNRLESARVAQDVSKASAAIRDLAAASEASGYPPGLHLAALSLLDWREVDATRSQAEAWMEQAAHLGGRYAWDLAVLRARAGRIGDAMAALGAALRATPAEATDDRLLRALLDQASYAGDTVHAVHALAGAVDAGPEPRRVATRAALYLVSRLFPERAAPLESLLARQAPAPGDLCRVLDVLSPGTSQQFGLSDGGMSAAPGPQPVTHPPAAHHAQLTAPFPAAVNGRPKPGLGTAHATAKDLQRQTETARRQFQQGNFDAAIAIARSALVDFPGDPDLSGIAVHAEAELTALTAERSRAVGTLRPAQPAKPLKAQAPRPRNTTLYARAQHADTQEKDWKKAEALYRQAIAEDPGHERRGAPLRGDCTATTAATRPSRSSVSPGRWCRRPCSTRT